jgi:hypothetical protein
VKLTTHLLLVPRSWRGAQLKHRDNFTLQISYEEGNDIPSKYSQILGVLNVLKPDLFQSQSVLKVYNVALNTSVLYGCENCTLKQRDIGEGKATQMKSMTRTAGYRLMKIY